MKAFQRVFGKGDGSGDIGHTSLEGTRSNDLSRLLFSKRERMMPLEDVVNAIEQGRSHNPEYYEEKMDSYYKGPFYKKGPFPGRCYRRVSKDRYKNIYNSVEKVIEGLCKQRGQELLMREINLETYILPTKYTSNELGGLTIPQGRSRSPVEGEVPPSDSYPGESQEAPNKSLNQT